jgi:hypothetical protein
MDTPDDEQRNHPTYDQPLNGPRKEGLTPLLIVLLVLGGVLVLFAVITWVRYNT